MIKKKKSKTKGRKLNTKDLRKAILYFLKRQAKRKWAAKQIIKKLKIANNKDAVTHALDQLTNEGKVIVYKDQKYRINQNQHFSETPKTERKMMEGRVDMTRTGAAYIIVDEAEEDIYVAARNLKGAMNGDEVLVAVQTPRGRRRPEGEVKKIIARASEFFMGTVHLHKRYGIVTTDAVYHPMEVYVDLENLQEAKDGEKVVVKIIKWPVRPKHHPVGQVTSVLGAAGTSDIEMKSILLNNGFSLEFPEEVLREAEQLSAEVAEEELANRRDFRQVTTFTIDPDTAKDFDDALSIQYLEDGQIEIGVHIADVSHYVKPETALDKEAYKRSTSVYLVDRVSPMLPERLSNELCSLRPHEDKCTFSAVFVFDQEYKVCKRWFGRTLIHSNRRFAYEEAQEILESGEGEFAVELRKLNEIAHKLRKRKFKKGAIAFESDEVKFKLDGEGKPIEVFVKERKDAHMLIEDFMLLANREVATYIVKKSGTKEIPFVYRVHDLPNQDKVMDFALFAGELGFKMNLDTPKQIAKSFNELTKAARKNEALKMLEPLAIRTMAKAAYTTDNIGHYGLAFDNYTHFTSPIRRYSDVLVHRYLFKNLKQTFRTDKEALETQCKHISAQERKAMNAERESVKYKQVEYVDQFVGQVMEGQVSGIIDRGIFIELIESKAEGLIGFDRLNDVFVIEEGRLKVSGKRTGQVYKMGDRLNVRILSTDLARRQIELELVER
ncbi:MAG: ribonuclease R [Bacteroidota bacterium]